MTSGPCQEISYTAITLNPESNFTRREKNHSLFHSNTLTFPELQERIWMLSRNAASMITGISMGQEICLKHGHVSPSSLYQVRNLQMDIRGPGRRLTKRQATSRPDHLWPELWRGMARSAKLREKHIWATEKPKLENARRLRGIYFTMPCKTCKHGVTRGKTNDSNQNLRASWKPVNPQECVWKTLY